MKVVLTGGSGFIGAAVSEELRALGYDVHVLDRVNGADVRDRAACHDLIAGADTVVHLAGVLGTDELFDDVQKAIDINVSGTVNVLDACVATGANYVGITMPPVFDSIYTASKVCAQRLAHAYNNAHGLKVAHVRAYNVFGPNQHHGPGHPRKIIPAFSCESWAGIPMVVWGDGTQTVDLVHTRDVGKVFAHVVEGLESGRTRPRAIIDAGTGRSFTVLEVARMVGAITGYTAVEFRPMRRGEVPTNIKATDFGWHRPHFEHEDFVAAVKSYRDHPLAQKETDRGAP